jgi:hypothetical protein
VRHAHVELKFGNQQHGLTPIGPTVLENVEDIVDSTMRPVCRYAFEGLEAVPKAPILQLCDESITSGTAILHDLRLRFISLPL